LKIQFKLAISDVDQILSQAVYSYHAALIRRCCGELLMPNSEPTAIPKSVMRLLESLEWKDCDPFDGDLTGFMVSYFQGLHREYLITNDRGAAPSRPSLSHAEAVDLMKEGVLRGFARQDQDGAIAINENAMHALQEFCHQTYAAWAKFQGKLETVERFHKSRAAAKAGSKRGKSVNGRSKTVQTL
jgi:hypothetical protein